MDWRVSADYPAPTSTRQAQWAWEFLRRNPEYRADWRSYVECCGALRAKYGAQIGGREPTDFAFDRGDPPGCVYEPARFDDESEESWLERVGRGRRTPLAVWICEKWGFNAAVPPDPRLQAFSDFRTKWVSSKTRVGLTRLSDAPRGLPLSGTDIQAIEFDLKRPLAPQLETAKRYLHRRQKQLIKGRLIDNRARGRAQPGGTYGRYLRALDALEEMGHAETKKPPATAVRAIGEALFAKQSNDAPEYLRDHRVRKMIFEAQRLRNSGCLLLPSHSASRESREKQRALARRTILRKEK